MSAWTACHELLRQGYGVEDIAIKLNCTAERVRREVAKLRATGTVLAVINREDTT
jgi:DNA-binding transcriptional regulator LsrR (DeoR family)